MQCTSLSLLLPCHIMYFTVKSEEPQVFSVSKPVQPLRLGEARSKGLAHLQWGSQCHHFEVNIDIDKRFVNAFLRFSMTSMDLTTIKNRPQPFLQVKTILNRERVQMYFQFVAEVGGMMAFFLGISLISLIGTILSSLPS